MEYYLDGTEIHDKAEFYDAVAATLNFPDWFGHNLDALADCLRDLSWLGPGEHVLVWSDTDVFEDADPDGYQAVTDVLTDVARRGFRAVLSR
jgi:RNAse (barnase) inhibitor barstar